MRAHVSGARWCVAFCSRGFAAAAVNELLHVLRDNASAWTAASGLRDVHSSICSQPPGVWAGHRSAPCRQPPHLTFQECMLDGASVCSPESWHFRPRARGQIVREGHKLQSRCLPPLVTSLASALADIPDGCLGLGLGCCCCCCWDESFCGGGAGAAGAASCFGAFLGAGFFSGAAPFASAALKSLHAATASCTSTVPWFASLSRSQACLLIC